MGGAYRLYEGQEQGMQDFCAESEANRPIGRHIGRGGRIILNGYSRNMIKGAWTILIWLRKVAGSCERSNELPHSIKYGEFLG
jgi:hypothetical protein